MIVRGSSSTSRLQLLLLFLLLGGDLLCCCCFTLPAVGQWRAPSATTTRRGGRGGQQQQRRLRLGCTFPLHSAPGFSGDEVILPPSFLVSRLEFFNAATASTFLLAPSTTTSFSTTSSSSRSVTNPSSSSLDLMVDLDVEIISRQCQNGALMPELAVPGAYNQACMNLPQRVLEFPIKNNKKDGSLQVTIQQLPSGSGKTGLTVWNSGLLLTRLLVAWIASSPEVQQWWKQQTVLELGCGTGLVSIVAGQLGAAHVLATDGNPDVISLAHTNVQRNNNSNNKNDHDEQRQQSSATPPPRVETQVLQWGLLSAMDYSDVASVVVGSDLTYNSGTWRVLAETMATVLQDDGIIIYLSLGHDGFNVRAELDGFLSVARENGLVPISAELEKLLLVHGGSSSGNSRDAVVVGPNGTTEPLSSSLFPSSSTSNSISSLSQLLDSVVSPLEQQQVLRPSGGATVVVLQKKQLLWKK
jgi:predicted nicotinamide N-methyase